MTVWNFFCKLRSSMIIGRLNGSFLRLSHCLFNSKNEWTCQEHPENPGVFFLDILFRITPSIGQGIVVQLSRQKSKLSHKYILYLIFNYPHKYYTFKHFEVYWNTHFTMNLPRLNEPWYDRKTTKGDSTSNYVSPDFLLYSWLLHSYFKFQDCFHHICINFSF